MAIRRLISSDGNHQEQRRPDPRDDLVRDRLLVDGRVAEIALNLLAPAQIANRHGMRRARASPLAASTQSGPSRPADSGLIIAVTAFPGANSTITKVNIEIPISTGMLMTSRRSRYCPTIDVPLAPPAVAQFQFDAQAGVQAAQTTTLVSSGSSSRDSIGISAIASKSSSTPRPGAVGSGMAPSTTRQRLLDDLDARRRCGCGPTR